MRLTLRTWVEIASSTAGEGSSASPATQNALELAHAELSAKEDGFREEMDADQLRLEVDLWNALSEKQVRRTRVVDRGSLPLSPARADQGCLVLDDPSTGPSFPSDL